MGKMDREKEGENMKKYMIVAISILAILFFYYEDAFSRSGGSSSSSSSSSRSSTSHSSPSRSSSGGKVVTHPSAPKVVGHGVANTPSTKSSHPMSSGAIGSKEYGQAGFKTTTPPPKAEEKNFVKYTTPATSTSPSTTVYYQPYPQHVYSNGGSGMPSWFWIWWMTSGNHRDSYHHDTETGQIVKQTTDVNTGQVIEKKEVDPSKFEEENSWAETSFAILAFTVLALFLGLMYWLGSKLFYRKKVRAY